MITLCLTRRSGASRQPSQGGGDALFPGHAACKGAIVKTSDVVKRYGCLSVSLFFNALGIALITQAHLGTTPITTLPYTLAAIFGLTLGTTTFACNLLFLLLQRILLRRRLGIAELLQIPAVLIFSVFIDFWMHLTGALVTDVYVWQIVMCIVGSAVLGAGISLEIMSNATVIPGEGLVIVIAARSRKNFGNIKVLFDCSLVLASCLLGLAVLGSIVGMVIGFVVFPLIIWYAYQMIFSMSTFTLHFYPGMAAASVAISAAVIGFATWNACRASLKEKTAALLLPRAPVAGKRIFLEYITPLWQHMSFSQKTTARNLFRYKKRFFMTVLGVAGCTALLLIGFGIQDSILPIVDKQSGQLTHNDLTISLSDEKALTMEQGLADTLDSSSAVHSWGAFYTKSTTLYNEEGGSADVSIVGAEDDARMTEYFTFRTRVGHDPIPFEEDSVILTEKTALNLELSVGDTFYVEAADGSRVQLTLTGITENYMFTRLYLSGAQLESLLGGTPEWNTVYGLTGCTTEAEYNALRTKLLDCNYVSSVSFTEDTTSMFGSLIGSLNYVVVLIIVCAAALAAVVLYNLISVNLAERKKELATIKVLGFYDKEVYRYIFREIELLSLIGSGVGLLLGVPLHRFIVLTVEMDQLMFIRTIAPRSYLLAVALTMLFTFVVCFAMRRHVRHISMVESMKAPE